MLGKFLGVHQPPYPLLAASLFIYTNKTLNCGSLVCECNETGSITPYCNEETGKCLCKIGFTGDKCDVCATGYKNCMVTGSAYHEMMLCDRVTFFEYPDHEYYEDTYGKDRKSGRGYLIFYWSGGLFSRE